MQSPDLGVTYTSTEICALKGSTVEISCSYRYPSRINPDAVETFWSTKESHSGPVDLRTDSKYSGRVQNRCNESDCILRITDLRESDSAEYRLMFITNQPERRFLGSPGVTLSVTVLKVQVTNQGYSKAELKCHSNCRVPGDLSYTWYKNGQKIEEEASSFSVTFNLKDSYTCALKGHEDFPSPSVCVNGRHCNKVMYTERSICAVKGSSVAISCFYSSHEYSVESKLWFTRDQSNQRQYYKQPEDQSEDSQYARRVQVESKRGRSTLIISDLRESDSAQYHFKFNTTGFEWGSDLPGTTLTVTDPDLHVQVSSVWFGYSAELKCHSSCHLPDKSSYIWYKNGQKMEKETSSFTVSPDSADSYSCALNGREDFSSLSVCVSGHTCNRVMYTDRNICALKRSSVDISCSYNSYKDEVESKFWFSSESSDQWRNPSTSEDPMKDSQYGRRVRVFETKRGRSILRISDLRESDSAQYHFKFKTRSFEWGSDLPGTTLTVTDLQVQVIRIIVQQQFYTEAELKCSSSCSPPGRPSYVWFSNGEKITKTDNSSYQDRFYPGDVISCAFKGHEDYGSPSVYALKVPSVSASPSGEIMGGDLVTLTCSSDANSAAKYTWYKNQTLLRREPQLVLSSVLSSDSGEYYCAAENELGRRTSQYIFINVKYAPKTCDVSVSPSAEIEEGSSVTLSCSSDANPAANYTWYKENQTLVQGPKGSYLFTSISSEDRGIYYCKSENQYGQISSTSLFVDVQYAPKHPSVSVSPSEIEEGSSVNLTCSSDANPAANYTWYKEDEDSPKASGQIFTITDFRAEHSGNYYCEAENNRGRRNSTLHLITVAGAWKSTAAGTTTAVVLAVFLLSVFILTRKKRAANRSSELRARRDDRRQRQRDDRRDDGRDDLHYASVLFYKNHADFLSSFIRPAQPRRHKKDESVVYAEVTFKRCQRSAAEDSAAALYSTVIKTN